jgi:hypothetical protein
MKAKDARRSDRVFIGVPIRVLGTDVTGEDFEDEGRTVSINRHGATIVLARKLSSVQQITMRNLATRKATKARVVGQLGGQPSGYVYAVALVDPTENIWNIRFPPLNESDKAVVRLLLGCAVCQASEVAYLNELEVEVFEANSNLSRSCQQCNGWTVWKLATPETALDHDRPGALGQPVASPSSPEARTPNKRQNVRVAMKKITACIRQAGFEEQIVRVVDLSRGGLRFRSPNTYYEGSRIEVAVPYSRDGANIFVPARIIRFQDLPEAEFKEYGVVYLKT